MPTKENPHRGGNALEHVRAMHERDPELQAEYDRLAARFEIVKHLILARRAGVLKRDIAKRAGVSQSTISRLGSAEHNPRLDTIVDVAKALGMRLDVKLVRDRKRAAAKK